MSTTLLADVFLGAVQPLKEAVKANHEAPPLDEGSIAVAHLTSLLQAFWDTTRGQIDRGIIGDLFLKVTDDGVQGAQAVLDYIAQLTAEGRVAKWDADKAIDLENARKRVMQIQTEAANLRDWYVAKLPSPEQRAALEEKVAALVGGSYVELKDAIE